MDENRSVMGGFFVLNSERSITFGINSRNERSNSTIVDGAVQLRSTG